jgi:CAAX protease family protein
VIPDPPPRPDLPRRDGEVPNETGRRRGPDGLAPVRWSPLEAVVVFLLGNLVLGFVVLAILAGVGVNVLEGASGTDQIIADLAVDLAFLAGLLGWFQMRQPGWPSVLGVPPKGSRAREFAWGAAAGVVLYPTIAIGVGFLLEFVFDLFSPTPVQAPAQLPEGLSGGAEILAVILAVFVAPLVEELFFRGVVFRSIRDRYGFPIGAIGSAVVFGLVHYVPAPWRDAALLQSAMVFTGLGLAWVYERRGTIVASIAAHMAFNTIGIWIILRSG